MKEFIYNILGKDKGISSKRGAGMALILSSIIIAFMVIIGMFFKLNLNIGLIEYVLTTLLASGTALLTSSLLEKK